jgi:succinoglycan biosynthesis protein ExoO
MSEPKFSVVIPLHNKARHVAAAIGSALMQSSPPHEILVIDDSSTDGSLEVVALISSPRLRLLSRDTPGPGGYAARNLGVAEATGDWIAFLDADDIWSEDHLADIASAIARSPTVGCVATRYDHVFDDRRVASNMPPMLADVEGHAVNFSGFLKLWVDNGECPLWTSASAFRRDILLQAGPFPAGKAVRGGDKDMWLRAARHAPFAYVPKISAEFHRDSDNKVSKTTSPDTVPLVVATARDMMRSATPAEKSLLRQLINQQIGLYARFSFKGQRISAQLARNLCLPEGVGLYLLIEGMRLMPAALRRRIYHMFQGARKRRLAAYE